MTSEDVHVAVDGLEEVRLQKLEETQLLFYLLVEGHMVVQVQVVFDELVKARKWLEFQELEEPLLLFYVLVEDHEFELEEVVQSHEIVEVEMVGLDAMECRHVVQVQMMFFISR